MECQCKGESVRVSVNICVWLCAVHSLIYIHTLVVHSPPFNIQLFNQKVEVGVCVSLWWWVCAFNIFLFLLDCGDNRD